MAEPSSLRLWQTQLSQHLKSGRLRYLQRIAVICAALDPPGGSVTGFLPPLSPLQYPLQFPSPYPPSQPNFASSTTPLQTTPPSSHFPSIPTNFVENQDSVIHKHGRLYIPNPFLLPTLHCCVVCIRRRSLTLKRILAALSAGDLSPLLDKDDVSMKGDAVVEIENTLQAAAQSNSLAKYLVRNRYSYTTPAVSFTALITAVLNRTLRFTEPASAESPLSPFDTIPLSLYFNELFETVFLDRWTTLHNAKALLESLQGAMEKSMSVELRIKDQKLPPATSPDAWIEHIDTCFDLLYEYQYRSPNIANAILRHIYQLHHQYRASTGPAHMYRPWWADSSLTTATVYITAPTTITTPTPTTIHTHASPTSGAINTSTVTTTRNSRLALLTRRLRFAVVDPANEDSVESIKYTMLILVSWANQQQPYLQGQLRRRKQTKIKEKDRDTGLLRDFYLPLDDEAAMLILEATDLAKAVVSRKDINFAPSLVFLLLTAGVLLPFSEQLGRVTIEYIMGLLHDNSWAEFIISHPRLSDILLPIAEFLATLRTPADLRVVSLVAGFISEESC